MTTHLCHSESSLGRVLALNEHLCVALTSVTQSLLNGDLCVTVYWGPGLRVSVHILNWSPELQSQHTGPRLSGALRS